jgi:pSer/pThr/pTyr-binding forkhead associated (FHA) protein
MTDHRLRRLDTGEEFALAGQMFIGRDDDCEITLEDPEVSRRHAVISVTEEGVVIADNGSTNGMEVSGRSSRRATLAHGQVVRIGETELCFLERGRSDDPTVATPPAGAAGSFVIDQGAGNDTAYRGGYAPLPGDASDQVSQKRERTAADPADTALMRQLIAHHGLTAVKTPAALMPIAGEKVGLHPLAESDSPEWLLGRGNHCEVVLDDPSVSTEHARLSCQDGVWVLEDLDSRNGTRCGGRHTVRAELSPGELIQLGNLMLLFNVVES